MTTPMPMPPEDSPAAQSPDGDASARLVAMHEQARLELVLRHEREMQAALDRHAGELAGLRQEVESALKSYRTALPEIVSLTRRVVELEDALERANRELAAAREAARSVERAGPPGDDGA